jgi:Ca2+-binding EF-hand superfamily protein
MKTSTLILSALTLSASAFAQDTTKPPSSAATTPPAFEQLDTNSDGRLSMSEAQAEPKLASKFATFDKQGKGYISKEEYQAYVKAETGR